LGLPYRTFLTLACVLLTLRYVLDSGAPARGKWTLAALTLATFGLPTSSALAWNIGAVLLQLGICLFVLLRQQASRSK